MKRLFLLLLALMLLAGCSAQPAPAPAATESPAPPAETAAVEPSAPVEPSQAPIETPAVESPAPAVLEVAGESSAPYHWAACDGQAMWFLGNDGLHRMSLDGGKDVLVDAGSIGQYASVDVLQDGRLLVRKRVTREEEDALIQQMPSWIYDYMGYLSAYRYVVVSADGTSVQPLVEPVSDVVFASPTEMICMRADASRDLLRVDLTTGETQVLDAVDLSNTLLHQSCVSDGVYYFRTLEEGQSNEDAEVFALDLQTLTVKEADDLPPVEDRDLITASALPEAKVECTAEGDNRFYAYTCGEESFCANLQVDVEAGVATLDFYKGAEASGQSLSHLLVKSIYSAFDPAVIFEYGEDAFIQQQQQHDGNYYAAYVEQIHLTFAGGWAFVYESSATNDVSGGPDRLIAKVRLIG